MKLLYSFGATVFAIYLVVVVLIAVNQRKLLYFPTHDNLPTLLNAWRIDGLVIGFSREIKHPKNIWLMLHGNGGQASHRDYALRCISPEDSFYVLEYPGYGPREGYYSKDSINAAALQAYEYLRRCFPGIPICVLGESMGSGPASYLAGATVPPEKIVLVVPFDTLASVAQEHFSFVPAGLLLFDRWDNREALKNYKGSLEIFGASDDRVIPLHHAKNLADKLPNAKFHDIPCGHNDWSANRYVQVRN